LAPDLLLYLKAGTFILDCRNDWRGFLLKFLQFQKWALQLEALKAPKAIPSFDLLCEGQGGEKQRRLSLPLRLNRLHKRPRVLNWRFCTSLTVLSDLQAPPVPACQIFSKQGGSFKPLRKIMMRSPHVEGKKLPSLTPYQDPKLGVRRLG
jgi:hypothetical protein